MYNTYKIIVRYFLKIFSLNDIMIYGYKIEIEKSFYFKSKRTEELFMKSILMIRF